MVKLQYFIFLVNITVHITDILQKHTCFSVVILKQSKRLERPTYLRNLIIENETVLATNASDVGSQMFV